MSGTRSLRWQGREVGILPASLHRCAAAFALGLLSTAAIVILSRRLAGSLVNPLPPGALLAAAILATAAAAAVRIGWLQQASASSRLDWAVMVWTSLTTLALIAGLYLPSTPSPWIVLAATVLAAEETWAWLPKRKRGRESFSPVKPHSAPLLQKKNSSDPFYVRVDAAHPTTRRPASQTEAAYGATSAIETVETIPPAEVLQQLTRSQAADGTEELFGWIRLPFAVGQRTGCIHVAFCPPLCVTPEVTVEQIEGPDARIKTAQLLPYGARFDLKLAAAAEASTTVVLQFLARAPRKG